MCLSLKTPIVLIIFKRPDTTEKVFEAIRQAKPPKLFVIADGPRSDRPGETEKCAATRAIIEQVDWDCEVIKDYSDINLGCEKRVFSGLNWVFKQVDRAIILEDDCVPDLSFFRFCDELLDRYKDDERVNGISAQNFSQAANQTAETYYFSRYPHCWGWATWRRAWQHLNFEMSEWPKVRAKRLIGDISLDDKRYKIWYKIFDRVYKNEINSWAYRWIFNCWLQNSLSIHPFTNLVENIGFSTDATNTSHKPDFYNQSTVQKLEFPINHPINILRDVQADNYLQDHLYAQWSLYKRVKTRFWKLIS